MDALVALTQRVSVSRLVEPAPSAEQRELLFKAALRAPDHAQLRPWRFLSIEGDARQCLGELFVRALQENPETAAAALDKALAAPLRAPLLLVVIASPKDHPKVPTSEQVLSAGCAAHALLQAAHAQGLGAIWRTGELAYHPTVAKGLGLSEGEQVIAFIYLGTPEGALRQPAALAPADFVQSWQG